MKKSSDSGLDIQFMFGNNTRYKELRGVYIVGTNQILINLNLTNKRKIVTDITNIVTHEVFHYLVEQANTKDKYTDDGEELSVKLASNTCTLYSIEKLLLLLKNKLKNKRLPIRNEQNRKVFKSKTLTRGV